MHAAGLSYRSSKRWLCGAKLFAALHRAAMTKFIEEEGEEEDRVRIGCGGADSINGRALGLEIWLLPFKVSV